MRETFKVDDLYNRFPYTTTVPNHCMDMTQLAFECVGDEAQLDSLISNTPFELADNKFLFSFTDYSNSKLFPYLDAIMILPVTYKGRTGGFPVFEWENLSRSVLGGREKWGYPKVFGNVHIDRDGDTAEATVTQGETIVAKADWASDSESTSAIDSSKYWPHFTIRALPYSDREGIEFAEVLERDTSSDQTTKRVDTGTGTLHFFGPAENEVRDGFADIHIESVTSAQWVVADWYSTSEHGWAHRVDRLR